MYKNFFVYPFLCIFLTSITNDEIFQAILNYDVDFHLTDNLSQSKGPATKGKKYVIGSWPGGMGVCLHSVLNQLHLCELHHYTPVVYWGSNSLYRNAKGFNGSSNVWEYYFQPVSELSYGGEPVNIFYNPSYTKFSYIHPRQHTPEAIQNERNYAYSLIQKYIKLNTIVQKKVDQFYQQHINANHTIGIHIRGTDKYKEEKPVSPATAVQAALKYAHEDSQFFIATDEQRILNELLTLLKDRRVVYYDCYRSQNGAPLHIRRPSYAQVGEDVIVEMYLLSKCNMLIHTPSNVSNFPLYLNPVLKHVLIEG